MSRISMGQMYATAHQNVANNFQRLFSAQNQLASGKRLQRPSDDPAAVGRLFNLVNQSNSISRYHRSIDASMSQIDMAASQLQDVTDQIERVRELTIQGANGSLTPGDRASIAAEVDQILGTIIGAANVKLGDRHLFAGSEAGSIPFTLTTGPDGVDRVTYSGNADIQRVEIAPNMKMELNVPGSSIFRGGSRSATTFTGATGAQPGAGSDSGTGHASLLVSHLLTRFGATPGLNGQDPATGILPSVSSTNGDTILGASHSLVVTTDALGAGTISLNSGAAVAFTSADTDLLVTGPNGEVVNLDMSAVLPNLASVSVPIDSQGTLSLDGGATTTSIDFSSSALQVASSQTGLLVNVDATGITGTGTESIDFPGTFDLFSSIIAIRDILQDTSLDQSAANAALNARLVELDRGRDDVAMGVSELAARHNRLEATESRLLDLDLTVRNLRSKIEDADLSQATLDMSRYESLYQGSLFLAARINQTSLINFL